jgi:hypothetical protein
MLVNTETLEQQIETLVREHLSACRQSARAAVERAVAAATKERPNAPTRRSTQNKTSGTRRPPRSREELAELGERFYAAVCETPGETMTVLAARLELPPRSLEKPVAHLKKAGRVRSARTRQFTRYFPMVENKPETEPGSKAVLTMVRS